MASTDARPVPIKNTAFRVTFPILDADGDRVTAAAGLDSEVSKDGGTFTDCTNEATEIATSSGVYYLDLTSSEMNADCVAIVVKTSTTDAKTTVLVLYPQESGDIKVDVQSFGGTAGTFASGRPEVNMTHIAGSAVSTSTAQLGVNIVQAGATAWNSGAITASTLAADAITAAKIATGAITNAKFAAGAIDSAALADAAITAAKIAADAITAAKVAADAVAEIQSGLATQSLLTAVGAAVSDTFEQVDTRLPAALVSGRIDSSVGAVVAAAITAAAFAANALDSNALAASAVTEIQSGLATSASQATIAAAIAALQAAIDDIDGRLPTALVSGRMDSSVGAMQSGTVTAAAVATGAIDADALATDAGNKIADQTLRRSLASARASANGDAASFRSLLGAASKLVNRLRALSGTLTIYQEDDTTAAGTQAMTGDADAEPTIELDTN